ncbi:MAG: T9SS type A sorting domain-containing protein [Bacteroidales bacterium]|nr:T9SS type A sorting domain-containing protein [Bacteroidales bacterium]
MKLIVLIILLLLLPVTAHPQEKLPGGVYGACIWEISKGIESGEAKWQSELNNTFNSGLSIRGRLKTINNNPALLFTDGSNTLNNTLNLSDLKLFSFFTVCQENDTLAERVIISLENDSTAEMVLTNRRMAALDVYRYVNYIEGQKTYPKIYSYIQNKSSQGAAASRKMQFGRAPGRQQLPVAAYKGLIPEVILFNRVLSNKERRQVETYLALKYGISLSQEFPASYLNSNGEIIWDAEANASYNSNIAGIGRDDLTGLKQKISESTQTPGLMKVSCINEMKNNSFVIWGDNGRPLRFEDDSGIRRLLRDWKICLFNSDACSLDIEINEMSFHEIKPLRKDEIYWMMIDRTGKGNYPFGQTDYYPGQSLTRESGIIKFSSPEIDADSSGSDIFTLVSAPLLFARAIVLSPSCNEEYSGSIQTEVAGGKAPFTITLSETSKSGYHQSVNINTRDHVFKSISQGSYILHVSDANKEIFTEEIWVSNTRSWESSIRNSYDITKNQELILNASEGMPALNFIYSWISPGGSQIFNEEIRITQPGTYWLSVTDEYNCNSILEINIQEAGESNFRKVELFPSPSGGWFMVRMNLERSADVLVVVSDESGRILKQKYLYGDSYYMYNDFLRQKGIYFITLVSGRDKETLRLIVQ